MRESGEPSEQAQSRDMLAGFSRKILSRLQALVESLGTGQSINALLVCGTNGRIQWANPAFLELSGYTLEELIGKKPGELLQGEATDPETIKQMKTALARDEDFHVQVVNYNKDGSPYWVDIRCSRLTDEYEHLEGFFALQMDITQQREIEYEKLKNDLIIETMSEQARIGGWSLDLVNHELTWTPMTRVIHEVPEDYELELDSAINFYKPGESREAIQAALD